ncbi:MAG: hypothetical protein U0401_33580 [Anaerolineae bacterium]
MMPELPWLDLCAVFCTQGVLQTGVWGGYLRLQRPAKNNSGEFHAASLGCGSNFSRPGWGDRKIPAHRKWSFMASCGTPCKPRRQGGQPVQCEE